MAKTPRKLAFGCLLNYEKNKFSHIDFLKLTLEDADALAQRDKAFIKTLVAGVLKQSALLDENIKKYSKTPLNKIKPQIITILRMGAYELLYMRTPAHAAIHEAVKLTKSVNLMGLSPYVNAVLRKIEQGESSTSISPYPAWFNEMLNTQYDGQIRGRVTEGSLAKTALTIRVNDIRYVNELISKCEKEGILIKKHPYAEDAFIIKNAQGLQRVPGFLEGRIAAQDVSGMLAVKCAGLQKGDIVVDVCAAPGSKAVYAAWITGGSGKVYAFDKSAAKVGKIFENAKRMRLDNIETAVADVSEFDFKNTALWGQCDVLLCDLPCSGLGVIGKKPDIMYNTNLTKIESLITLQRKILMNVWGFLKPGGVLLYSTCTVNKQENIENIEWFTDNYPFTLQAIDEYLPIALRGAESAKGYIQLLQGVHLSDGAFIARLVRR